MNRLLVLVDCKRLNGRLTEEACVKRWRIANRRNRGAGLAAQQTAGLAACKGCEIGAGRAAAEGAR